MKPSGIHFPTAMETALLNAAEYRGLTISQRMDCLLALIRIAEGASRDATIKARQVAEHDRQKHAELSALVGTQVEGHV